MPKSQIIRDLVDDAVPLEKSLTRLLVLAKDVKNDQLSSWAENELNGYKKDDELPDYRQVKNLSLKYSGFNGQTQVNNVPLSIGWLSKETRNTLAIISMYDGIGYISELASGDQTPGRDLTQLAGEVAQSTNNGIQCVLISQVIPKAFLHRIYSTVKGKMITALYELEKKYGNLDRLGIDISKTHRVQIEAINADINKAVFNISLPSAGQKNERWYSKIGWNIIAPVITGILGVVLGALAMKYFGL